jgi:hypothetical protein
MTMSFGGAPFPDQKAAGAASDRDDLPTTIPEVVSPTVRKPHDPPAKQNRTSDSTKFFFTVLSSSTNSAVYYLKTIASLKASLFNAMNSLILQCTTVMG